VPDFGINTLSESKKQDELLHNTRATPTGCTMMPVPSYLPFAEVIFALLFE